MILYLIADFILHIDKHLVLIIQNFGAWSYLLLFLIIFAETGLVVLPFLPGDSLLFASGALAAAGSFNIVELVLVIFAAAVLGDSANYAVGKLIGDKMIKSGSRFLKKEYLDRTHNFYEKYGGKTIVLARFVPIVRTFAPFVAGLGKMNYLHFFVYNVTGGFLWVALFVLGGYFFGNVPVVKNNFSLVIILIIIISVMPMVIEYIRHRRQKAEESKK
jgi:membrane-associated protein